MNKMINYLFVGILASAAALGTSSCSDDEECPTLPADFKVSKENVVFLKNGGDEVFHVNAPATPEVTPEADWIAAAVARHGTSNSVYAVTLTAQPNPDMTDRTATVKVRFGGQESTVNILQAAAETVALMTSEVSVDHKGGTLQIAYKASGEVNVDVPEWIAVKSARAAADYTLTLAVDMNMGDAREGNVTVSLLSDPAEKAVLVVKQGAYKQAEMTYGESAIDAAKNIYAGWNLGNTLEVPAGETAWGNPKTSKAIIDMVAQGGFNAVRLPAAWSAYLEADAEPYTIKADWLARVREVVDYAFANDMYVILNDHWDNGWLELNCNAAAKDAVVKKEKAIWTQIANYFADYGDKLIFAGNNEMRNKRGDNENWGNPNAEELDAMMAYNQAFVDAVRATGGNNATRNLVIQSWCCNPWRLLDADFKVSTDPADGHLMVECHYYDPQSFTHWSTSDPMPAFWGYREGFTTSTSNQEDAIDSLFGQIKAAYVDKGIPVILGEYGTNNHTTSDQTMKDSEKYYLKYVTMAAKNNGLVPFYWDNATPGPGSFGIFNRFTLTVGQPHFLEGIMEGAAAGNYPY